MSEAVSKRQFWVGIVATILVTVIATLGSCVTTLWQIKAQRAESQRAQDSQNLKEIGVAASALRQQLGSYVLALLQFEGCMKQPKATVQRCRGALYSHDADALGQAWTTLDGTIRAASPLFTSKEEAPLLESLRKLRAAYADSINPLLPTDASAERAAAIAKKTRDAIDQLSETEEALLRAVTKRASTQ